MKKKTLRHDGWAKAATIAALGLVSQFFAQTAAADKGDHFDVEINGLYYSFTIKSEEDKTAEFTEFKDAAGYSVAAPEQMDLPATANGYSVVAIGYRACYNSSTLKRVSIPSSVTSIEGYAFSGCSALEAVTIPASVKNMGSFAFSRCTSLRSLTLEDGLTSWLSTVFQGCTALETVTIPGSIEYLGQQAFENCTGLKKVVINEGLLDIGVTTFSGCSSLESVSLPASLTQKHWSPNTFAGCNALRQVTVAEGNPVYDSRGGCNAIIETATDKLVMGCIGTVIPEGVRHIDDYAFISCGSGLTSITLPSTLISVGNRSFIYCTSLAKVTALGTDPWDLDENAFNVATEYDDSWQPLEPVYTVTTLYVPTGCASAYRAASGWNKIANIVEFDPTAIAAPEAAAAEEAERFAASGARLSAPRKGVNLVRMSDGSVRKVLER